MGKGDAGQINEVLAKMLCHNMCVPITATHEPGVEQIFGRGTGAEPIWFGQQLFLVQFPPMPLTIRYLYVKCT